MTLLVTVICVCLYRYDVFPELAARFVDAKGPKANPNPFLERALSWVFTMKRGNV